MLKLLAVGVISLKSNKLGRQIFFRCIFKGQLMGLKIEQPILKISMRIILKTKRVLDQHQRTLKRFAFDAGVAPLTINYSSSCKVQNIKTHAMH
jgi:hypothetical protein